MILVGVDAGGTSTISIAYTCEGKFIGTGESGPGNFHNIGLEDTVNNIRDAIYKSTKGLKPDVACIGLAGLDSKYDYEILSSALKDLAKETIIEHDSFISLYAETRGKPGIIIISGTGSVIMGYDGKKRIRVGGAGWLLSDEGSAYWIGRKALRLLVKMLDGREEKTILADLIMEKLSINSLDDLIKWTYHEGHKIDEIASLAEVVDIAANKGDKKAQELFYLAAKELSEDAIHISKKLGIKIAYMNGGMFSSKLFKSYVVDLLKKEGIIALDKKKSPEFGALLIAFNKAGCITEPEEQPLHS
ncbi:BadF/BadG/BcrA/BcrD ATPase family protein [Acidianus sp. HS-5]|uniref:BadF/BadG/BcrA/BcrD ATPase family protein n=1 Tax=Acidianus sp. HS-5 TaxID=2886040 RepID=UPI001F3BD9CB|nr:BadF/BadG/BcrA/BcrD ATPase family protein [Acidianus sp. HS-5]BDC19584.1 ATPase [Acidianus sp. HS-5]